MDTSQTFLYWRHSTNDPLVFAPFCIKVIGHRLAPLGWQHPPSWIPCFNFYFVIRGEAKVQIGHRSFNMSEGNYFFQSPKEKVSAYSTSELWEYYWIAFEGPLVQPIFKQLQIQMATCYQSKKKLEPLFRQLCQVIPLAHKKNEIIASQIFYQILLEIANEEKDKVVKKGHNYLVQRCLLIIEENYLDSQFGVNQLAQLVGKNRSIITRAFNQAGYQSPSRYIADLRLKYALTLFQTKKLNINEVANQAGFTDPAYFSRFIKKSLGVSPKIIQENMR